MLTGRHPQISAQAARQTARGLAIEMGRGAGKAIQIGAPRLEAAMEANLAWPSFDRRWKAPARQFQNTSFPRQRDEGSRIPGADLYAFAREVTGTIQ
ncbi:hypothetical protein AB0T83_01590 [Fluviibacterium sp. DFM31]|uniref:Uncharacterized protein n=1 Tax=Meridianimarinicoccus marinus TaxID=3231483 RepID=A0ABV3L1U6_9RHOB